MVNSGLAYWSAALTGPVSVNADAAAALKNHPRFEEACRLLIANGIARYRQDSVFARATKDISRFFFGYFALYLDARGGLTLSSIRDLCAEMGLASPGRAAAILLRLRMIGFVEPDPVPKDRRVRRYLPTKEMRAAFLQINRDDLMAMALVEPEAETAANRLDDADFYRAFILRIGEGIAGVAADGAAANNPATLFTTRNSGSMILLDIASSGEPGDAYPPRGTVRMNVRELSRKYDVSRSHVHKLLLDAEKAGLLKRNPDEQTGVLSENLRASIISLHVTQLIGSAVSAHAAVVATAHARQAGDEGAARRLHSSAQSARDR